MTSTGREHEGGAIERGGSEGYGARNPDWHEADAAHKARAIGSLIRFAGLRPELVADVGCGTGEVLRLLQAELAVDPTFAGTTWEGWDIAPDAIARARRRESATLRFVCGDFLASERQVDLVLCVDTFEHVSDDLGFLRALRGRATWFVFRIPLDLSVLDVLRPARLLAARERWGHRHAYTRALALGVLAEAGYAVEVERYDRVPPRLASSRQRVVDAARRAWFALDPHRAVQLVGGWSLLICARRA